MQFRWVYLFSWVRYVLESVGKDLVEERNEQHVFFSRFKYLTVSFEKWNCVALVIAEHPTALIKTFSISAVIRFWWKVVKKEEKKKRRKPYVPINIFIAWNSVEFVSFNDDVVAFFLFAFFFRNCKTIFVAIHGREGEWKKKRVHHLIS